MKLVRKSRLFFREGKSDKVYEVDLCDVSTALKPDRFVVNFRYGRRGSNLREGTKTRTAVSREEADKLFDSVVVSKVNKGYRDVAGGAADISPPRPAPTTPSSTSSRHEGAMERVRAGLSDIVTGQLSDRAACRIVWRAGELRAPEFVPSMTRLLPTGSDMLDYALLWALGRCGEHAAYGAVSAQLSDAKSDSTRRMALWSSLRLATDTERRALLESLQARLPDALVDVFGTDEKLRLRAALDEYFVADKPACNDALVDLYLLSWDRDNLRDAVLGVLAVVPFKPNYFRGVRQVYKAAEFFGDAAVYGLLARRFDTTRSFFAIPSYGNRVPVMTPRWEYINYEKELRKAESRLAYSSKTRTYLRRRSWRGLRRLGELGLDDYVEMAMGVLLAHRAEHKQKERKNKIFFWDNSTQRSYEHVISYDAYSPLVAFNQILHQNSTRYRSRGRHQAWQLNPDVAPGDDREEAFPELWDRHPDALLSLMREAELEPVHRFASRAIATQPEYCKSIPVAALVALLQQPFECTVEFAFRVARDRYDPANPDFELVLALLNSVHDEAIAAAQSWVNENPAVFAGSVDFTLAVMTARTGEIRHWGRVLLESAAQKIAAELVDATIAWLLGQPAETIDAERVSDVEWALLGPLGAASRHIDFDEVLALLAHSAPSVQALAGRLVINHERPAAEVPATVYSRLLESPVAEVRGVGVELFAQLPDAVIAAQPELVESFCVAPEAEVRAGVRPAVGRLASSDDTFAGALMRRLVDHLFRREKSDGVHDDLVSLLTNELAAQSARSDRDLNWRLLQARSTGAQAFGAWLLTYRQAADFSVRQWARLGRHADIAAREWAWQCYRGNPGQIAGHAVDALRIVDSDWQDSRNFAFEYFRETFPADAWTPELMIGICDSVREDVQVFGRELITMFFAEEDGPEYLLKLSQHPSANVQLFASNYLEGYASGNVERLQKLQPYFVTVLSQVNRNRVTKDRILDFLLREAALSSQVAHLVARIFGRQSVTVAISDKARYLAGMRDLAAQYPEIDMPLTIVQPPVYPLPAEGAQP